MCLVYGMTQTSSYLVKASDYRCFYFFAFLFLIVSEFPMNQGLETATTA